MLFWTSHFLVLDSTFFVLDSTFWLDSTLKIDSVPDTTVSLTQRLHACCQCLDCPLYIRVHGYDLHRLHASCVSSTATNIKRTTELLVLRTCCVFHQLCTSARLQFDPSRSWEAENSWRASRARRRCNVFRRTFYVTLMPVRAVPIRQKLVGDLRMHKRMHADCNMTIYTVFGKKHPLLFSCITLTKC